MNDDMKPLDFDTLNDLLDGVLDAETEARVRAQLDRCPDSRQAFEELTGVVASLGSLETSARPSRDLWSGIEARITESEETPVVPLHPDRPAADHPEPRTVRVPVGLAWAAGIALVLLSGSTIWSALNRGTGGTDAVAIEAVPAPDASFAGAGGGDPALIPSVENLEMILERARAVLDPETVRVLEESLEQIDAAIREAEAALVADPGNAVLNRILGNHQRAQFRLIGQASNLLARS